MQVYTQKLSKRMRVTPFLASNTVVHHDIDFDGLCRVVASATAAANDLVVINGESPCVQCRTVVPSHPDRKKTSSRAV